MGSKKPSEKFAAEKSSKDFYLQTHHLRISGTGKFTNHKLLCLGRYSGEILLQVSLVILFSWHSLMFARKNSTLGDTDAQKMLRHVHIHNYY